MVYSSTHSALNVQEGRKERRESRRLSDKASELSIQADNELAEQRCESPLITAELHAVWLH